LICFCFSFFLLTGGTARGQNTPATFLEAGGQAWGTGNYNGFTFTYHLTDGNVEGIRLIGERSAYWMKWAENPDTLDWADGSANCNMNNIGGSTDFYWYVPTNEPGTTTWTFTKYKLESTCTGSENYPYNFYWSPDKEDMNSADMVGDTTFYDIYSDDAACPYDTHSLSTIPLLVHITGLADYCSYLSYKTFEWGVPAWRHWHYLRTLSSDGNELSLGWELVDNSDPQSPPKEFPSIREPLPTGRFI
jgi:hypothetical protein